MHGAGTFHWEVTGCAGDGEHLNKVIIKRMLILKEGLTVSQTLVAAFALCYHVRVPVRSGDLVLLFTARTPAQKHACLSMPEASIQPRWWESVSEGETTDLSQLARNSA